MSHEAPTPLTADDLARFARSEVFYGHPLNAGCVYSEGVQYLAEKASAYWRIDAILCRQPSDAVLLETGFQVWTLTVNANRSAALVCTHGDENHVFSQQIAWTDFPLNSVTLWFANRTLYLPGEH